MAEQEDLIAEKSLLAMKSIDLRMQKEIANFINLKTHLALAKSGIDTRILPKSEVETFMSKHTILFKDIEKGMTEY